MVLKRHNVGRQYLYLLYLDENIQGGGGGMGGVGKRAIIRWDKEQEIDWNIVMDWLAG